MPKIKNFKKPYFIRKRSKTTPIKKLQRRAEELWKKCCRLRDLLKWSGCMVEYYFPEEPINHSKILQVDHCFSRTNKLLFIDPRNGTTVCSTCNGMKNWDKRSVGRLIDEIVKMREGEEVFEEMKSIDRSGVVNDTWGNPIWLEQKIKELENIAIDLTLKCSELESKYFKGDY